MNEELPHRFRESTFRDYEAIIGQIVQTYPQCLCWRPKLYGKAQATFSSRLRDAMESYRKYNWSTNHIDRARFVAIWPLDQPSNPIRVSERSDGTVLTGITSTIKAFVHATSNQVPLSFEVTPINENTFCWDFSKPVEDNLCLASMAHAISPRIQLTNITNEKVLELQTRFDVAIEGPIDGRYILI